MDGGMPRETELLAESMTEFVEHVFIYCYTYSSNDTITRENLTIRSFHLPQILWGRNIFYLPSPLSKLLDKNMDDLDALIITSSFIPENVSVAKKAMETGIPYFVSPGAGFNPYTYRCTNFIKKSIYERFFERPILDNANGIRLYSQEQYKHLARRGFEVQSKSFIVKEGVDWKGIEAEAGNKGVHESHSIFNPNYPPMFGFLGRLSVYTKGLDLLLKAWSIYKQSGGPGCLKLVGPGSERDFIHLKKLQDNLDLQDIEFHPPIFGAQKYDFLAKLSMLVHPSRHEGIPRVIREAFAVGCPVLLTSNTNLHDIVAQYRAGMIVDAEPWDIARKMLAFTELSKLQKLDMRKGARAAAYSLNWEYIADRYVKEIENRINVRSREVSVNAN